MEYFSQSLQETAEIAKKILGHLSVSNNATILALEGELGSGKTTFVQAIAKSLGAHGNITSPTFVIFKQYSVHSARYKTLIHIDAYRLHNGKKLAALGIAQFLKDPDNLILIEWAERVRDVLPKKRVTINFYHINETTRKISVD